jgi:hypothetical protein
MSEEIYEDNTYQLRILNKFYHTQRVVSEIKKWLKEEVERTELNDESLCESNDDFIVFGRRECAEGLLKQIEKWEDK